MLISADLGTQNLKCKDVEEPGFLACALLLNPVSDGHSRKELTWCIHAYWSVWLKDELATWHTERDGEGEGGPNWESVIQQQN